MMTIDFADNDIGLDGERALDEINMCVLRWRECVNCALVVPLSSEHSAPIDSRDDYLYRATVI